MASSSYASTEETTNACRACRLLLGPCTDQLRNVLLHHVPLSTFPCVIKQKISSLARPTTPQLNLILPRGSTYTGNYTDMDISLLYTLLRNICSIPPHIKGWGYDPDPTDRSLSANIERIRIARNQCVHSYSPVLPNAEFNTIWSTVRSAIVDLDSFLNNRNQYEREVDFLRHETMDHIRDRHFTEELRKQAQEDAATREIVHGLKHDVSKLKNTAIPPNVKAINETIFLQWKKNDQFFHESHNFPAMLDKVRNKPHVTFVGVPGSGKTATARHIALMLQQEGYEIVPIKDIRKIEDYCDPNNPQVFVIDDVVGVFGLQEAKLNLLFDYQHIIKKPLFSESKTLMTCRETVYRTAIQSESLFSEENNIVLLHSESNALDYSDKVSILKIYNIDANLLSNATFASLSKMFPYLCKLFTKESKIKQYGSSFFENPVPCILKELDEMKKENRIHYVTLVLCIMNKNKMSEKILEEAETTVITKNFIEMKRHVLRKCKVNSYTNNFEFVDALSEMEGTYTTRNGTEYTLIHDSMLEIIAYHFGCQFPDLILQFMSSSYIANNVKVQENKPINGNNELSGEGHNRLYSESKSEPYDLCIKLREEMYLMLAERLYRDIENMELYDVFMNNVLKEPRVYQAFEEVLETKSDTELESLFLSERTDISKVMNKCERDSKELNSDRGRQNALLNKESESKTKHLIRVISWVIYYGHNRILQYILKRMEDERRAPVLFKNITMNEINEKYRLLLLSCYSGDLKIVKICMKYLDNDTLNTVLRRTLSWYKCPLTAACEGGNISIVKELLVAGASANLPSESTTPLIAACRYGHMDVAKELIKAGAEVNFKVHNETPLMAALIKGHASVVQELIKLKADINLPGGYDFKGSSDTPLSLACRTGNESIVKDLLKAGADVNVKGSSDTPLSLACRTGNESIVKDLLKAGADVNIKGSSDTPLSLACSNGNICIVKDLIKAGADVNLGLIFSSREKRRLTDLEFRDIWIGVNHRNNFKTPFISACAHGQISIVQLLLEVGADVNLKDGYDTPLTMACKSGHTSIVKKLLEAGADANIQDSEGRTPIYLILLNNTETSIPIELMVKRYSADPTICDKEGFSAFCIALINNKVEFVNQLFLTENNTQLYRLKIHLFDCLVNIRQGDVILDRKDDVVVKRRGVFHMKKSGLMYKSIFECKCDVLKRLLNLGLDVNQAVQVFNGGSDYDVKPHLFSLIDEGVESFRDNLVEKVKILLEAKADVNVRVKYKEYLPGSRRYSFSDILINLFSTLAGAKNYDMGSTLERTNSVLDEEGLSVLERIQKLIGKFRRKIYYLNKDKIPLCEEVLGEIKKHVRRYSV